MDTRLTSICKAVFQGWLARFKYQLNLRPFPTNKKYNTILMFIQVTPTTVVDVKEGPVVNK